MWDSGTWPHSEAAEEWKAVYEIFCKPGRKISGQAMRKTLQDTFADLKEPDWPEEVADKEAKSGDAETDGVEESGDDPF